MHRDRETSSRHTRTRNLDHSNAGGPMDSNKVKSIVSSSEIRRWRQPSTWRGSQAILFDWGVITASLAACALLPHPLTVGIALVLIGGRQLGLAILMHEAAHRTLLRHRDWNDWAGKWLCAGPMWLDLQRYRTHHLAHHAHTGTGRDPDLCLVEPFPTDRLGLLRKFARDLTGLTGLKRVVATLAMDFERITYTASGGAQRIRDPEPGGLRRASQRLLPMLTAQTVLLVVAWACGHAWLYLVWAGAWLTTYSLFLRIRAIAEHACTERTADTYRNTRSVEAGVLARATVAPHRVNYHLPHHVLMTVPFFRLPQLQDLLQRRGAAPAPTANYFAVLRLVCRPTAEKA